MADYMLVSPLMLVRKHQLYSIARYGMFKDAANDKFIGVCAYMQTAIHTSLGTEHVTLIWGELPLIINVVSPGGG